MTYQQEDYDPARIIAVLVDHGVRFVVVGGTAATIRGADVATVDTDVSPARDPDNLDRLADALAELGAKLRTPEGELVDAPLDAAALRKYTSCATRSADAGDLDLIFTPDGIPGGYETLAADAEHVQIAGRGVLIASAAQIQASREAAYLRTGQAKYARGNDALTLAVEVAGDIAQGAVRADEARAPTRAEQVAERARRYAAERPRRGSEPPRPDLGATI